MAVSDEAALVERVRNGDEAAFEEIVREHRRELTAHCYRMLGSVQDAEDALQEAMLAGWRALPRFEGRSSLRTWLYRITTNVCLRQASRRPPRRLTPDMGASFRQSTDLGEIVHGPVWLEPWPDDVASPDAAGQPEAQLERIRGVELAYVAALQHLPASQRAVLIMREVLELSAAEVADALETTTGSVNSALQRAREAVALRVPPVDQQSELRALGDEGRRRLVDSFVSAWQSADVDALVTLLADDARLMMPPLPAWFDGRAAVADFVRERMFAAPWSLVPVSANGQLAFACYQRGDAADLDRLGALIVVSVRAGRVDEIVAFLDPEIQRRFAPLTRHATG